MKLYLFPTSYWSRNVALAAAEKGLEPEVEVVDIRVGGTFEPEYMRLNPRGVVPTLVSDEGEVVWDGPTIVRWLDERHPPRLMREEDPEVKRWCEKLIDFPVMLFSYSVWIRGERGENSAQILDDKIRRAARLAQEHPDLAEAYERKRVFFERFRAQVNDHEHVARESAKWREVLDEMGQKVEGGGWLAGEYSFADTLATSILYRLVDLGRLDHWSREPGHGLHGYFQRLKGRSSFGRVFTDLAQLL